MHRLFIPLYRYFHRHPKLMVLLIIIPFLIFLFFGLQVHFEEDISKLLPTSSVESQLAFSSIGLKDKIFIQMTSADEPLSPEILGERTDEFVDLLTQQDSSTHYIANILSKMEPESALNALDFVLEMCLPLSIPLLIPPLNRHWSLLPWRCSLMRTMR